MDFDTQGGNGIQNACLGIILRARIGMTLLKMRVERSNCRHANSSRLS